MINGIFRWTLLKVCLPLKVGVFFWGKSDECNCSMELWNYSITWLNYLPTLRNIELINVSLWLSFLVGLHEIEWRFIPRTLYRLYCEKSLCDWNYYVIQSNKVLLRFQLWKFYWRLSFTARLSAKIQ